MNKSNYIYNSASTDNFDNFHIEVTDDDLTEAKLNDSVFDYFFWNIGLKRRLSNDFKRRLKIVIENKFVNNLNERLKEIKERRKKASDNLVKLLESQLYLIQSIKQARPLFSKDQEAPNIIEIDFQSRYDMSLFDQNVLNEEINHLDTKIMEIQYILTSKIKKQDPLLETVRLYINEIDGLQETNTFEFEEFKNKLIEDHVALEDGEHRFFDENFLYSQTIGKKVRSKLKIKSENAFKDLLKQMDESEKITDPEIISSINEVTNIKTKQSANSVYVDKEKNLNKTNLFLIPST